MRLASDGEFACHVSEPGRIQTSLDEGRGDLPRGGDAAAFEPVGDGFGAVAALEVAERGRLRGRSIASSDAASRCCQ